MAKGPQQMPPQTLSDDEKRFWILRQNLGTFSQRSLLKAAHRLCESRNDGRRMSGFTVEEYMRVIRDTLEEHGQMDSGTKTIQNAASQAGAENKATQQDISAGWP
eukprot:3115492-Rhodomonas_salina.1